MIDVKKWAKNMAVFAVPVLLIYLVPIYATIITPGHVIALTDFALTQTTIGAIVAYIMNSAIDLLKKFRSDNTDK